MSGPGTPGKGSDLIRLVSDTSVDAIEGVDDHAGDITRSCKALLNRTRLLVVDELDTR